MEIKRVQCPQCNTVYDIKNSKGETEKIFACQKCQKMLRVRFSNPVVNNDEPVDAIPVDPNSQGRTILAGQQPGITNNTVLLNKAVTRGVLCVGDKEYKLCEGKNTVGRKSVNSTASLQLDVNDLYMSRRHAIIRCVNAGKPTYKAIISNDQNKNITYINGNPLEKDDELILTNGCEIKMGDTVVVYKEVK